ncbi:prenyltransferase [Alteromonas flava]|uniref:prenyltransferase n=1 Tax=Alteromonas flava TaxID=2048003 RepID=UPI000C281347|nr:prenyltransferase [Alteromonas flava]
MVQLLIGVSRPPFLVLVVSLLLFLAGLLNAMAQLIDWVRFALVGVAALAAHMAVNAHNEYCDHISGLDTITHKTPFSGGSGTLQREAFSPRIALYFAIFCALVGAAVGFYLWITSSQSLILAGLGILGLVLIFTYTPLINQHPLLCLIAPGLGFGLVVLYGSFLAIAQEQSLAILFAALAIAGLSNNLLLLNQFPDRAADAAIGRNHWVIDNTLSVCVITYVVEFLLSLACLVLCLLLLAVPIIAFIGLIPMLLGCAVAINLNKLSDFNIQPKILGLNVACTVLTPLLLGGMLCVVA